MAAMSKPQGTKEPQPKSERKQQVTKLNSNKRRKTCLNRLLRCGEQVASTNQLQNHQEPASFLEGINQPYEPLTSPAHLRHTPHRNPINRQ